MAMQGFPAAWSISDCAGPSVERLPTVSVGFPRVVSDILAAVKTNALGYVGFWSFDIVNGSVFWGSDLKVSMLKH